MTKHRVTLESRQRRLGYAFIAPFIVGLLVFVLWPFFQSVTFSFCNLTMTDTGYQLEFVGLENYREIFLVNPQYRQYLLESLQDMAINVPVCVLFAFFVASLLNAKFVGRSVARVILFLPVIVSSGLVTKLLKGYTMETLTSATETAAGAGLSGAIVNLMNRMSLSPALVGFISGSVDRISDILTMAAVPIIIFLAGLQSVSPSIFEASYIEGATKWEVFWKICLPMVSPLILVTIVYSVIDSFTNVSNPVISDIHSTIFESIKFGVGTAKALSYMLIMGIILAVVYKIVSRFVFYQDR